MKLIEWLKYLKKLTNRHTKPKIYMTENTTFMETSENNHAPTG